MLGYTTNVWISKPTTTNRKYPPIEESIEETERLLKRAINLRTVSDVPIGAFLSGGVDSGLISSLLARESKTQIRTFSVGLNGFDEMNELPDAGIVAKRYGTDHNEIIADANLTSSLAELMNFFARSALLRFATAIPQYAMAQSGSSIAACLKLRSASKYQNP